jgi:hypothetical protein
MVDYYLMLSISTTASATTAESSTFSAAGTTGSTASSAEVSFIASLTAATSSTSEAPFTATTATARSTFSFHLGFSFIDSNSPSLQFLAVQTINGCLSGFFSGHFDKAESFGSAAEFIHNYTD